jgi:hypothetical protein
MAICASNAGNLLEGGQGFPRLCKECEPELVKRAKREANKVTYGKFQDIAHATISASKYAEDILRAALLPATKGPLTKQEAESLILAIALAFGSINYRVPEILEDLFPK